MRRTQPITKGHVQLLQWLHGKQQQHKKMNVVWVEQASGTEAGADSEAGVAAIVPHPRLTATTTTTIEIIEGNLTCAP